MPDPAAARAFRRDLIRLERALSGETRAAMNETRLRLVDALARLGVASAALATIFRAEMDSLARRASAIGREQEPAAQLAAAEMARSQFEAVAAAPLFGPAQAATTARREETARLLTSTAWVEALSARLQADLAQLKAGNEPVEAAQQQLFGERGSAWRAGENNMELSNQRNLWTVGVNLAALYYLAGQAQSGQAWFKMALATLDGDTTETCINANGQVQPLDEPFELDGEPQFASRQMHPPFHWNCRTVEVLAREA